MTRLSSSARAVGLAGLLGVIAIAALGVSAAGAATTGHAAGCTTTVSGAAWKIKGLGFGSTYTLKAVGMPCATAKKWTVTFSKETETGKTLKGPAGFKCESLASKISGDTHVYDGSCQKGTPATAIFVRAPKR
jgi:hypothetical protein